MTEIDTVFNEILPDLWRGRSHSDIMAPQGSEVFLRRIKNRLLILVIAA
jgi:hypothetical protein